VRTVTRWTTARDDRGLAGGDDGDAHAAAVDVDDRAVDELRFV